MWYVSSEIMGGLGNQLFQIFAAIAYAIKHKKEFVFIYDKVSASITPRVTYWDNLLSKLKQYTTFHDNKIKIDDLGNTISDNYIRNFQNKYRERNFHYDEIPKINNNLLLQGYYQSYKYFYPYKKEICELLCLNEKQDEIKNKYENYFYKENHLEKNISMHFRLGDYKKLSEYHPILSFDYYMKSMTYIKDLGFQNGRVLYFCEEEDIVFIEPQIKQLENMFQGFKFVRVSEKIPDWEQMLMMSLCDINIIANSSFSLFGAYLNRNSVYSSNDTTNHIVIYPSVWFGKALQSYNLNDLYFNNWKKIEL